MLAAVELTAPILILNELNEDTYVRIAQLAGDTFKPDKVFQFGLSPEGEAADVARRAWADGATRMVAIAPNSSLGQRLLDAFTEKWEQLGGTLLQPVYYDDTDSRYSNAVKQAFNLYQSSARAQRLRETVQRRILYDLRARRDVDAVFVAGYPLENRQLLPQLRYFGVANVAAYSTSHTFTGKVDPGNDLDLDGMVFGDMPLVIGGGDSAMTARFRDDWPRLGANATRMFAFGGDAYRLVDKLPRMRYQSGLSIAAATGVLSVNLNGRVQRELSFAKFVKGVPTRVDGRNY